VSGEAFEERVFLEIEQGYLKLRILNSPLGKKTLFELQLFERLDGRLRLASSEPKILNDTREFKAELVAFLTRCERLSDATKLGSGGGRA
jgi:hypothetical protein